MSTIHTFMFLAGMCEGQHVGQENIDVAGYIFAMVLTQW